MLKDMDFGFYGKGIDGYVHYSLTMDRIREKEESCKTQMDERNRDMNGRDADDFGSDDFGCNDF